MLLWSTKVNAWCVALFTNTYTNRWKHTYHSLHGKVSFIASILFAYVNLFLAAWDLLYLIVFQPKWFPFKEKFLITWRMKGINHIVLVIRVLYNTTILRAMITWWLGQTSQNIFQRCVKRVSKPWLHRIRIFLLFIKPIGTWTTMCWFYLLFITVMLADKPSQTNVYVDDPWICNAHINHCNTLRCRFCIIVPEISSIIPMHAWVAHAHPKYILGTVW